MPRDADPDRPRLLPTILALLLWGSAALVVGLGPRSPVPLPVTVEPVLAYSIAGFLLTRGLWRVVRRVRPGPAGEVLGRSLRAAGWGLLTYGGLTVLGGEVGTLAPAAGLGVLAVLVYLQHRRVPEEDEGWTRALVALTGLGLVTVATLLAILGAGSAGPLRGRLAILAVVGLATLAATHVARTLTASPRPRVARTAHLLAARPRRVLGVVLGVTAYGLHRSLLAANVRYLHVAEWILGLALLGYALERLTAWYRRDARDHPWEAPWTRHEQEVAQLPDATVEQVETATARFLAGDLPPGEYAALWQRLADDLDAPELRDAAASLEHLEEADEPLLRLPWRVRRVREANRRRRMQAHERILTTLDTP